MIRLTNASSSGRSSHSAGPGHRPKTEAQTPDPGLPRSVPPPPIPERPERDTPERDDPDEPEPNKPPIPPPWRNEGEARNVLAGA
jgi:hypothetical protein